MAFQARFGRLQSAARKELELKHNAVELVEEELDTLPRKIMKENLRYITRVSNRATRFTNLRKFFQHLHLYCWTFFEYKVLEVLINNNCSAELKGRMKSYVGDIQTFKDKTKISDFIKYALQSPHDLVKKTDPEAPETFKKLRNYNSLVNITHTYMYTL